MDNIYGGFYVLGIILNVSSLLTHVYLVLITTTEGRCYYPHFADEKTEAQRLCILLKVTELTRVELVLRPGQDGSR